MSGKVPSVHSLDQPEKLDTLLKQDRAEDCLSCRVIGGGAFLGLAGYSYWTGMAQLERQEAAIKASKSFFGIRSRKLGIGAIAFGLAYLGVWRLRK